MREEHDHKPGWWSPRCAPCLREQLRDTKRERDDLAEGMFRLLRHDFPSIRDADDHCDILWQWMELICEKVEQERSEGRKPDPNFAAIADNAIAIRTAIQKSSYLGRRLYGGEEHRTEPCPKHEGKWSGLPFGSNSCDYGCQLTGWLPAGSSDGG